MRIGFVGSTDLTEYQRVVVGALTEALIEWYRSFDGLLTVVSGGAPGVDTVAELDAIALGVPTDIIRPKNWRWEPEGFKARNILIAESVEELWVIRSKQSKTFGSGWTGEYYEKISGRKAKWVTV